MRYALPCSILACAALSGCANPTGELEARMIELEFRMNTLEARLDVLAPYADRVEALETALSLPGEDDQLLARLLDLEARLVELERARDDAPADEAAPDDRGRVIQMGPAPPGVERIAPKPDLPVRVVATGSGGLLLVEDRDTGQLVRVELLGIHPPLRENEYADYPGLREQFLDALGAVFYPVIGSRDVGTLWRRRITDTLSRGADPRGIRAVVRRNDSGRSEHEEVGCRARHAPAR